MYNLLFFLLSQMKEFIYHSGAPPKTMPELKAKILLCRDHIQDEFGGPTGVPGAPKRQGAIVRTFAQLPRRAQACIHEDGGPFLANKIPR